MLRGYVILTSELGSILRAWFDSLITGYVVSLTAADGIGTGTKALRTKADTLNADVTGTGLINIFNKGNVDLENVTTNNGSINIKAKGIVALNVVSKIDALGNDITLTATTGDIHTGNITAGSTNGNVTLNANDGSIDDDASISANNIFLKCS